MVYLDKLMAAEQARLRASTASIHPAPSKQTQSAPVSQTAPTAAAKTMTVSHRKRFKPSAQTRPARSFSKFQVAWLILTFVLALIVPPLGSVLLLWTFVRAFIIKFKEASAAEKSQP